MITGKIQKICISLVNTKIAYPAFSSFAHNGQGSDISHESSDELFPEGVYSYLFSLKRKMESIKMIHNWFGNLKHTWRWQNFPIKCLNYKNFRTMVLMGTFSSSLVHLLLIICGQQGNEFNEFALVVHTVCYGLFWCALSLSNVL